MEPVGASLEGEWSCLSGIYTNEEADFMAQLLGSGFGVSSAFWSSNESGTIDNHDSSDFSDINYNEILYSYSGGSSFGMDDVTNYIASYLVEGINDQSWNTAIGRGNLEESAQPDHNLQPNIETGIPRSKPWAANKSNANPSEISKKRSKNAGNAEKTMENVRSKKSQKLASSCNSSEEECNAAGLDGPATSSCCSDDEFNESYELNGGSGSSSLNTKSTLAPNSNGKTRGGRGSATDPQSLYARKRRERINERLRILQNIVPNGIKVDISTMLEAAVQYVKFLQLQIKLLSSDDLWMYAPIAFNGMDIGLDRKLPATI